MNARLSLAGACNTGTLTAGNHQKFLTHLGASEGPRQIVARHLNALGHQVILPPPLRAPTHAEWRKFRDHGDLFITQRVEVKGLSAQFTCKEDWPYGGDFIVCAKHSWDEASPKPIAYFYLNRDETHYAFVAGKSSAMWTVGVRQDRRYDGVSQECYFCPISLVSFGSLG